MVLADNFFRVFLIARETTGEGHPCLFDIAHWDKGEKQGKEIKAEQFTDTVTLRRIRTDRSLDGGSLGGWVFPAPRKWGPRSISGP